MLGSPGTMRKLTDFVKHFGFNHNLKQKEIFTMSGYSKSDLVDEYKNTVDYFRINRREVPVSTKFFSNNLGDLHLDDSIVGDCQIDILGEDSYNLAIKFKEDGLNPMVLNMASDFVPGGGVRKGSTAQEEELFRRSNAHMTHPSGMYPLETESVIYSPEVTIIKASRDKNYHMLEHEVKVGMIACAAIRNPVLTSKNSYSNEDMEIMSRKIESIFRVGLLKGHDSLVLGAMGCGAFHNPPAVVAALFKEMVDKYGKHYKRIGFAILVVRGSDTPNFNAFKRAFNK